MPACCWPSSTCAPGKRRQRGKAAGAAKALGADAQRSRFELVDAYLQQGRFQLALEELEREALPADGQARGLALKGRAIRAPG